MMKKIWILPVFLLASLHHLNAQTELKVSPVALLFGGLAFSAEQQITPSFGLDADILAAVDGFGANLSGKYYFDPQQGIDRFHIGIFAGGITDNGVGGGFLAGYKWVSSKRIVFEAGVGVGRTFDGGITGYGKLHIGYRFVKK
jgi:hypothetical protein